jgi:peptide/nickel transport system ATP-binding protein
VTNVQLLTDPVVRDQPRPMVVLDRVVKHFPVKGRRLRRRRPRVHSVDGVSLTIRRGEVLGLVGESGCGKSTLARVILRLVGTDTGRVVVDDVDISRAGGAALRKLRRSMQLIFQDPAAALDPRMRLGTSLEAPLAQHHIGSRPQRRQLASRALAEVGLDDSFLHRRPEECSGGQLQRVVIARALLLHPKLLVCDEPTSALDASVRAQILNLLMDLRREHDLTLLMISHDLRVVRFVSDRVAVMYLGQIVELADRSQLFDTPAHPYTKALLAAALPETIADPDQPPAARGEPPSPIRPPSGCRFHPRCPIARERCRQEAPQLTEIAPGHHVSCHFWNEDR